MPFCLIANEILCQIFRFFISLLLASSPNCNLLFYVDCWKVTAPKKWSFPSRVSSVNVTKFAMSCGIWSYLLKKPLTEKFIFCEVSHGSSTIINPLSANPTKSSNTLKQFVSNFLLKGLRRPFSCLKGHNFISEFFISCILLTHNFRKIAASKHFMFYLLFVFEKVTWLL